MLFTLLIISNRSTELTAEEQAFVEAAVITEDESADDGLFDGRHDVEKEIIYIDGHPTTYIRDNSIGHDRLSGVILSDEPDVLVVGDGHRDNIAITRNIHDENLLLDRRDDIIIDETIVGHGHSSVVGVGVRDRVHELRGDFSTGHEINLRDRLDQDVDVGILDRRLNESIDSHNRELDDLLTSTKEKPENFGIDGNDLAGLTLAKDDEEELGLDIDDFKNEEIGSNGYGLDKGKLYAYNYPSQGVGAGIGNAGIGAAAGFAGLGAGVGQAVLNGETVPTLGGVGTSPIIPQNLEVTPENDKDKDGLPASVEEQIGTNPNNADTDGDGINDGDEVSSYSNPLEKTSTPFNPGSAPLPQVGGVGGLVSGAGSGVAAGLVTGQVIEKLGLGIGVGKGEGAGGYGGIGRNYNFDHLPPDGALHIMIHVDGSGSILSTRKQLDEMKDTLLKDALLPYYNNDEGLYNKRVTIVDSAGERTLQFFSDAARKANVLAVAFQDEAAPDYHLPTFNKAPQPAYKEDLNKLKSNLLRYGGLYRGIMFQVDRGKTFAKSFKEMVECSWNGEGYLDKENLSKYHRDNNLHHIKGKSGIVFSDEYHAKSEGDPQYYLNLLFKASNRIGLNLDIYGGGLTDGKQNLKID